VFFVIPLFQLQNVRSIISYKITNDIFTFQNHIEGVHQQVWNQWIAQEKYDLEGKK